ncbi:glycosyl hydrolase family 95 catalytic domain-containing protein [Klenkia taihuensis]|uniref:Alpha-L-fucosidase 2 n=1 Tax=Klenkia taihuensis TaxID=1225127 RepID=A0A1I1U391_9ACTN|nr:glycoside hydrolase N-terminal domain-containing protein [Klenkia taihuensis]GHE06960.1 hypothetical protein GCM10011381_01040 [Klenkia taihuensis]SFD65174.1 alpha-L-fucosidase 2 [Klenkia taihuensis]
MPVLRFPAPAASWVERLPLGDGRLGAMPDGGVEEARFDLNHEGLWSGSPVSEAQAGLVDPATAAQHLAAARAALTREDPVAAEDELACLQTVWGQAYLPLGTLVLRRQASAAGYTRSLDLDTATHRVRTEDLDERSVIASPLHVLSIESSLPVTADLQTQLRVLERTSQGDELTLTVRAPSDVAPPHETGARTPTWDDGPGRAVEAVVVVRVRPTDRGTWWVTLAAETTYRVPDMRLDGDAAAAGQRARDRLDRAAALGVETVFDEGTRTHRELFGRSAIDTAHDDEPDGWLPDRLARAFCGGHPLGNDPGLAGLLYDVGRYLLISSSRPGGLPANLQGIWNDQLRPPWSSSFTTNINLQMNYWSAHAAGLTETAAPLRDFVLRLAEAGTATATRLYGARGWAAHHNADAWLYSTPVGHGQGECRWSAWPLGSAWLACAVHEAVAHGAGKDEAARIWPAVRGAAQFALDWHHQDATGRWVTAPATSPENVYRHRGRDVAVDATTAMDQQLIAHLFDITEELGDLLGFADDEVVSAVRDRRPHLVAQPVVVATGTVQEWDGPHEEEDPQHRHVSHLYGLFPGPGHWQGTARQAAGATLERRGDDSTGWSLVWKTALWARLGRGDKVGDLLALLFRPVPQDAGPEAGGLYPNLFAAHPPFQIDANLGYPAVLVEALVQSHPGLGRIELLPALPPQLARGAARGLVVRPGIECDLTWQAGDLVEVRFRPRQHVDVVVGYRGGSHRLVGSGPVHLRRDDFAGGTG